MQIIFKNKTVEISFSSKYKKKWKYPKQVALKLEAAENYIEQAGNLLDIINYFPFRWHSLKGARKGEWSIYLGNTGYRVTMIPCDGNGEEIICGDIISRCKSIKIVMVTEVSNHYE